MKLIIYINITKSKAHISRKGMSYIATKEGTAFLGGFFKESNLYIQIQ